MKTFAALVLTFALVAYAAAAPLHDAAKQGNTKAIVALLDVGADPNERDTNHASPLHWAANRGHTEAIVALLDAGADPNARDRGRVTPPALGG